MTSVGSFLKAIRHLPVHSARTAALVVVLLVAAASAGMYAPAAFGQTGDPEAAVWPFSPSCASGEDGVAADAFVRTELFFGSIKPDGSEVTEEEFSRFIDEQITPRFPDGLTLLTGYGQFRNSQGTIVQETSRLLILLYPVEGRQESSQKIEEIRELFNQAFQQESVLRSDDPMPVCVSF